MIRSIRRFLFITLFICITLASTITAIGNYLLDRKIIQPYLDGELARIYTVIEKLNQLTHIDALTRSKIQNYLKTTSHVYFMFQIWDNEGRLLFHSTNSAAMTLKETPLGFSDLLIGKDTWRAYAAIDHKTEAKIIVAEIYDIRNKLANTITRSNIYILLVTYPIFAILIWIIVGFALRSLTKVTNEISNRASTHLEPVDITYLPIEVKPLVAELNELLMRLQKTYERNKRFAADAAHELRTPLAALKTQAQVALKADNVNERQHALSQLVRSVDRSSHLVTQLLTLSRVTQENILMDPHPIDLYQLAIETITHLVPTALEKKVDVELDPPPHEVLVWGNETMLSILIRNIIDNAIRYTPPNGFIKIAFTNKEKSIILSVVDNGPGIPSDLRERVFERFYRILDKTTVGSGLGLAIVHQIAELHHAEIRLSTPTNDIGLQFEVYFPLFKT